MNKIILSLQTVFKLLQRPTEKQVAEASVSAETQGTLEDTQPGGETVQNVSYFGNAGSLKRDTGGGMQTRQNPNKYRGMAVNSKWQPVCLANTNFVIRANIRHKLLEYNGFHENPIRIAQWLQAMLDTDQVPSKTALCHLAGVSRSRVIQYLNLLTLPPDYVFPLRYFDGLQESHLRPLVGVGIERQRQGLNRVISRMGGAVLKLAG